MGIFAIGGYNSASFIRGCGVESGVHAAGKLSFGIYDAAVRGRGVVVGPNATI